MQRPQTSEARYPLIPLGPRLEAVLEVAYRARRSVLLEGPTGIGKSEIVRQVADRLGIATVVLDLSLLEPPDLVGLARRVEGDLGDEANAELVSEVVRVISEKASLELDQDAKLDGKQIKLNCKGAHASVAGKRIRVKTKKVKLRLTDQDFAALGSSFAPLAAKPFPRAASAPAAGRDGNSMCLASGLQHYACIKGPPPEHPPWKGAQIFSIDPKQRQLAGLVDGHLRVWSATGEVRYAQ